MESISRSELEAIAPGNPHFQWSIEELLKLHYREQNWPSFFAYAQYYRAAFSDSVRTRIQLLEGLALLRHCQNETLERLMREWKGQSWFSEGIQKHLSALSKTSFKGKEAEAAPQKTSLYWKGAALKASPRQDLLKGHPKNFYLKVSNQCGM